MVCVVLSLNVIPLVNVFVPPIVWLPVVYTPLVTVVALPAFVAFTALVALVAFVAFVAFVAKATDWLPMLLLVMNEPPDWGFVAVAALPVVFWLSVGKVQLAKLPDAGVPSTGAVIVGLVSVLLVSV